MAAYAYLTKRRPKQGGWELPSIVAGFIAKAARRLANERTPFEDLRIVGETAAWKAISEFRPGGEAKLATFQCSKALGAMRHYRRKESREVYVGEELLGLVWYTDIAEDVTRSAELDHVLNQLEAQESDLLWMHTGYEVPFVEIADRLGQSRRKIAHCHNKALRKARGIASFLSLQERTALRLSAVPAAA